METQEDCTPLHQERLRLEVSASSENGWRRSRTASLSISGRSNQEVGAASSLHSISSCVRRESSQAMVMLRVAFKLAR